MVEASKKYKVHIQHGSGPAVGEAMDFIHKGGIGDLYMARGLCYNNRDSYGIAEPGTPPEGFHYDMWLGPAPERPYAERRGHYCWHWYWDTGSGDTGNQGPHQLHAARVALQENEHPVTIFANGGLYGFRQDNNKTPAKMAYGDVEIFGDDKTTQETPNVLMCTFKYKDGKMLVFETRDRSTNAEGMNNTRVGNFFYGTKGHMEYTGGWKAFRIRETTPFAGEGIGEKSSMKQIDYSHLFGNLIDVIRSGRDQDLINPILGGHYSAALAHLANISYRLGGRELRFDNATEKFIDNDEANRMLTRDYRKPYVVPDKI